MKKDEQIPLPCGKCPPCLARRVSGWSFRLRKEGERSLSAQFITLTYNTTHVPISERGFMTLKKKDVQDFMKRLRKRSLSKLRYYVCGEYGSKNKRPHYHMVLFNADIESVIGAWSLNNKPIGDVHFGDVNGASIGYVLKYMNKPKTVPMHQNDDRIPEFSLMSKRLGDNYLTQNMIQWHKDDLENRVFIKIEDGKKIPLPRYYKQKMYDEEEQQKILIAHKEQSIQHQQKTILELGEDWENILIQRKYEAFRRMYANSTKNRNL